MELKRRKNSKDTPVSCGTAVNSITSTEQAKALVQAIVQLAQEKWGPDYIPELVRAYSEIEYRETGKPTATPNNRRSQIIALLRDANPRTQTLMRLLTAVEAELQLVVIRKEVKSFS